MASLGVSETSESEDVAAFLQRVKELGEKRDRQDDERSRKLEQDILEGREQRAARRAERARSISPEKASSSPSRHPASAALGNPQRTPTPSLNDSPSLANISATKPLGGSEHVAAVDPVKSPTLSGQENRPSSPAKASPSVAVAPTRSGTLSWQQRPATLRGPRGRPLSGAAQPSTPSNSATDELKSSTEDEPATREQIAQSLATKDPAWFRQTADRGIGSAAYRKQQEITTEPLGLNGSRRGLHGMSREPTSSVEPSVSPSPPSTKSWSPATSTSLRGSAAGTDQRSSATSAAGNTSGDFESPLPLRSTQKVQGTDPDPAFLTPEASKEADDVAAPSSLHRRERSTSPTKGMGGFVQSAMLKRSDSINKRWSAQATGGLGRQNSKSTSRATPGGSQSSIKPSAILTPTTQDSHQGEETKEAIGDEGTSAPPSPSKRWSPVKSTWLESALNKPESPKPKPTNAQPSWMADLNKSKQRSSKTDSQIFDSSEAVRSQTAHTVLKESGPEDQAGPTEPKSPPLPTRTKAEPLLATSQSEAPIEQKASAASLSTLSSATPGDVPFAKSPAPSPSTKPKPATPPKKDFRASLKSREPPKEDDKKDELEFRNAFGKLRRTQTEKFVAPDEFKSNILRGKAALNTTDGPQKSVRRDEFQESLLKKKEAMRAKVAESGSVALSSKANVPTDTVPEAIARKKALSTTGTSDNILPPDNASKSILNKAVENRSENVKPALPATQKPATKGVSTFSSAPMTDAGKPQNFNAALAGILARGPPGSAPESKSSSTARSATPIAAEESQTSSGNLQHMTKSRAKGPKRRLPKAEPSAAPEKTVPSSFPGTPAVKDIPKESNSSATILPTQSKPNTLTKNEKPETPPKPVKPQTVPTPTPSRTTRTLQNLNEATPGAATSFSSKSSSPAQGGTLQETERAQPLKQTPVGLGIAVSKAEERPTVSVKNALARWGEKEASPGSPTVQPKSPIKLPTRKDEEAAHERVGITQGGKFDTRPPETPPEKDRGVKAVESVQKPSAPLPKPEATVAVVAEPKINKDDSPKSPPTSEPTQLLQDFFDEPPVTTSSLDVDTQAVLASNQTNAEKCKTVRKTINEITGDGKTLPLPQNHEHILYSDKMYLCAHHFDNAAGRRSTEVYFWTGANVSDATVEDAQLFARKAAKDNQGSLIPFRQGKESANFFEALGGIVITRNGSSRANATPYMLCGRRHLGHIAFDEVELSLGKLCSGFPFIVSSGKGTLFIWRGDGCDAEELGCARLISMDLEPEYATVEVEEGKETKDFLATFPQGSTIRSASFWKLKPKHESYRVRLFQVEMGHKDESMVSAAWQLVRRPSQPSVTGQTQITEVVPFCQADLEPENIYVLDAFFEMYIIVGSLANTKAKAFGSALLFAQDYGILAASTEDRPNVPVSTVVLEGFPKDLKSAFRRWDDNLVPTSALLSGRPKRGKSLKIMSLSSALAATSR